MDFMPLEWLMEMPPVTRLWVVGIVGLSVCEQFNLVSEFQLVYSFNQTFLQHEYWRLLTCFMYFGKLNVHLFFNLYFLIRYSRALEEAPLQRPGGRPGPAAATTTAAAAAEYLWTLLLLGSSLLVASTYFSLLGFLGPMLSNALIYIWARRNPDINLSFLGVFVFRAPYLPWIMLLFSAMMGLHANGGAAGGVAGTQLVTEALSIAVGHVYFFLEDIAPQVYRGSRPLAPPWHWLEARQQEQTRVAANVPAPAPQQRQLAAVAPEGGHVLGEAPAARPLAPPQAPAAAPVAPENAATASGSSATGADTEDPPALRQRAAAPAPEQD